MTAAVDSIVLRSADDDEIPSQKQIRLFGHPSSEADPTDAISLVICEYDENTVTATFDTVASFYIPVDQLLKSLELVLDCELTLCRETA